MERLRRREETAARHRHYVAASVLALLHLHLHPKGTVCQRSFEKTLKHPHPPAEPSDGKPWAGVSQASGSHQAAPGAHSSSQKKYTEQSQPVRAPAHILILVLARSRRHPLRRSCRVLVLLLLLL